MPTNYRCKYNNIWDSTTRRYRNCKNIKCHGDFCTIHYKLLYTEHSIMIQKMYKGYYIRKKLKIYYNLPRDLQRKIIWHMNSDLYRRNFNSSVFKLIQNRYIKFLSNKNYRNILIDPGYVYYTKLENHELYTEFIMELYAIIKISIKYYQIIDTQKIKRWFLLIKRFNITYASYVTKESEEYKILLRYNLLINY